MQTKQQIKQLLTSAGVAPNKRRDQHFLIDLNLMQLLIDTAHIRGDDIVVEAGCGTGSLTEELAPRAGRVIAVEIDNTLAQIAQSRLAKFDNVRIINVDVLKSKNKFDHNFKQALEQGCNEYFGRVLLVSNLPYSAAASIMMNLIVGPMVADCMYVTVQKEVADRMTAAPSSENYGVLSILMAATGRAKLIRTLRPTVFWPRPQVNSAMMQFHRSKEKVTGIYNMGYFKDVVNLFMGHRRKMLKASVKFAEGQLAKVHNWYDIFERAFVEPNRRPEDLPADAYIAIANLCYESLH